ncbi:MAG: hypothetical protein IPI01_04390 [Ignavibacteriae bacterium]|nr:hypothetical protein [Ignavibacteriota bacterium]
MAHRNGVRLLIAVVLVLAASLSAFSQTTRTGWDPVHGPDTIQAGQEPIDPTSPGLYPNIWSIDVLISNDGFGLGGLYRRSFTQDLSGFISLSVSESKDEREFEYIDPYYGVSYTPGKLNRFLVIPLMVGVQYRLFREDIVDTFRPYINAGAGPAMIYQMPYMDFIDRGDGVKTEEQVEFFKSIGRGHPQYTAGGFIGFGSNFGTERSNIFGVNFRYYVTYMFGEGLPSLYDVRTREVSARKKSFGGFVISLNIGMAL